MNSKKLCSLGILDININLFLYESQMMDIDLKLDSYNSIDDLPNLFEKLNSTLISQKNKNMNEKEEEKSFHYFNYENIIKLDSDNCLINSLLYINKAYKNKTFIEFIIPDKIEFNDKNIFLKNFLDEILTKNYLFIVENDKIKNNFSKVNFVIKIVDDIYDKIKLTKKFEIIGNSGISSEKSVYSSEDNEDFEKLFLNQFNYNFNRIDYFLIDLKQIRKILMKEENIHTFLLKIIKAFPKLKIILIIDENIIKENSSKEEIIYIKKYLELCDIIFSFKNNINNFLRFYYSSIKREITDKNPSKIFFWLNNNNFNLNNIDLITKDYNKFRKNIPRISLILDEFNLVHIYEQDIINKNISFNKFYRLSITQDEITEEKNNYMISNADKLYHIFIGGFLSRFLYNKLYDICFEAGNLLLKKALKILSKNEMDIEQDLFNVKVKNNGYKIIEKMKNDIKKENNFVLDCTNKEKSKQKEYNILTDNNCLGFLTSKYFFKNNREPTLMDKVDKILKSRKNKTTLNSPTNIEKCNLIMKEKNISNKKSMKRLLPYIVNNDIKNYQKAKANLKPNNIINLKTIPYLSHSKHTNLNMIKKSSHTNNILKHCINNINKSENYNQFLFKVYLPDINFQDYIKKNNL
jgi:hypothetical protein